MKHFTSIAIVISLSALLVCIVPVKSLEAAEVVVKVDLSKQRMHVFVAGRRKFVWRVSTGKKGWRTPTGNFQPYKTYRNYYEKRWNANLPYLVMIHASGGIGIHGTHQSGRLGRPASHGCIRLSVGNAAKFYKLVQKHGLYNSKVTVHP